MRMTRMLIAVLALCLVPFAFAQDQPEGKRHGGGGHGGRMGGDPEQHLQMLTKQLNLSQEQQDKIRPILQEQHTKMQQAMQSNQNASQDERRSQMQQLHNDTVSRVREVLNDDQKKKFDTMQKNMMEHRHGHGDHEHGDHDHGDQKTPPPGM